VKSSVQFKSLAFLTKISIDWNQWFKSHWFKSANPAMFVYWCCIVETIRT